MIRKRASFDYAAVVTNMGCVCVQPNVQPTTLRSISVWTPAPSKPEKFPDINERRERMVQTKIRRGLCEGSELLTNRRRQFDP